MGYYVRKKITEYAKYGSARPDGTEQGNGGNNIRICVGWGDGKTEAWRGVPNSYLEIFADGGIDCYHYFKPEGDGAGRSCGHGCDFGCGSSKIYDSAANRLSHSKDDKHW